MPSSLPEFYCPYTDKCFECCLETEMALSEKDITRIADLGYEIADFLEEKDGFIILKNIEGHCFFLKGKLCSIYEERPQGCRFYPLIYDLEIDDFVVDNLCTHHEDFDTEIYRPLFDPIQTFVYTLVGEREIRVKKMIEEEEQELKEILGESLEEESKNIKSEIEKIEEIVEETIEDATSEELEVLEEALEEEMREIEEDIEKLEKGIEEEIKGMEDEVEDLGQEIKKEIDTIEEKLHRAHITIDDHEDEEEKEE